MDSALDGFICSNEFLGPFGDVEACAKRGDMKAANQLWLNHTLFAPARENPAVEHKLAEMVGDYSGWHWANKDPTRPSDPPAIKYRQPDESGQDPTGLSPPLALRASPASGCRKGLKKHGSSTPFPI